VDLDPVAIELDFMEPLVAGRRLGFSVASCGLMNPGISAEVAAATTLRARPVITLLKRPAYRVDLKESRGFVMTANSSKVDLIRQAREYGSSRWRRGRGLRRPRVGSAIFRQPITIRVRGVGTLKPFLR